MVSDPANAGISPIHSTYDARIKAIREYEYPMLKDQVYLDHAGMTLPAKSLMTSFGNEMSSTLFGNPHSTSTSSQLSTSRIEDIRMRVLQMFNADPARFDVVFVANATAGIKLVAEALRGTPEGFEYVYHQWSHTSLVGVRQEAKNSMCVDSEGMINWLDKQSRDCQVRADRPTLLAYPAQSNLDGRRLPLSWCNLARTSKHEKRIVTLLDAASYVSTSMLNLSDHHSAPDFTVLSFYKIFGFPDVGALVVKRECADVLMKRRYFGGGTVDSVISGPEAWHARKTRSIHQLLEDGTLPIHNILALNTAMDTHFRLFGTMNDISTHTSHLSKRLKRRLRALQHGNGTPACAIYSTEPEHHNDDGCGPIVAFNLKNEHGSWTSLSDFQKLASLQNFHLRTGTVCNPGGSSEILGLSSAQVKKNYADGFRCGDDNDLINGQPTGVIRASLGAMSTESDVDRFINFVQEFYVTRSDITAKPDEIRYGQDITTGTIQDIIVYPIKSCKGFHIPKNISWQVRPEGLMWDREWCLVHRGTGRALSQKRYPRMALLQPSIDLKNGTLSVVYLGFTPHGTPDSVSIPLTEDSDISNSRGLLEWTVSRVCGETVNVERYISHHISEFFSNALGVPCDLARCSPKIHKAAMRLGKVRRLPEMCPQSAWDQSAPRAPACTTRGTTQHNTKGHQILLSNESPILAVTTSSLEALNAAIRASGGRDVSADVFRANIVIASSPEASAYAEDDWSDIRIDRLNFNVLGPCQRCHMVCIDPETGVKGAEPFVSLSRTRRFDGKVWFGIHMTMDRHVDTEDLMEEDHVVSVGQRILGNSAKSPNLPELT
ncbi:Molybdenum cofactor sulfurase [Colletotrichum tropicale]|nr:Molybdenum cofactor sulfurase [Colletotrichum tropicale]